MKQAIVKKGIVFSEEIPSPQVSEGRILIKVVNSCISAGTEGGTVSNSGKSLLKRIISQPDQIKKVIDGVKNRGVSILFNKIKGELQSGKQIGYSVSGIVKKVGENADEFHVGDHVTASGAGFAVHAEFVSVPKNLVVKIPKDMNLEHASIVTIGTIALQGVRRADLRLGEYCVVYGTGIIGMLTLQILRTAGIKTAAIDIIDQRLNLAEELGADKIINPSVESDVVEAVNNWTNGYGADAVIFTASTGSDQLLSNSFKMCRRKGKVVLVGVSGMNINRNDIYAKELDFLISTSYGPGRYDDNYEIKGNDYPYSYVRWTEKRNMEEFLRLVYTGKINVSKIITDKFPIDQIGDAYRVLMESPQKSLCVIVQYDKGNDFLQNESTVIKVNPKQNSSKSIINVALIGAGSFGVNTHLSNLSKMKDKYCIYAVASKNGYNAKKAASQYNASYTTSDYDDIFTDENVDLVIIATRHHNHAELVLKSLKSNKHVFVEKPLAVNLSELEEIHKFYKTELPNHPLLFVGYNRRFSKYASEIKKHLKSRNSALIINYNMNAGFINYDHWVHEYGGRIVGESCHIIDLFNFFTEAEIETISCSSLGTTSGRYKGSDNKSILFKYSDGSICTLNYYSNGSKQLSKERMEINFDGKTILLDDYKELTGYGLKIGNVKSLVSDKGHCDELIELHKYLTGKSENRPIEFWDLFQTTRATLLISNMENE